MQARKTGWAPIGKHAPPALERTFRRRRGGEFGSEQQERAVRCLSLYHPGHHVYIVIGFFTEREGPGSQRE